MGRRTPLGRLTRAAVVAVTLASAGAVTLPAPVGALTWAPALCRSFAECTAKGLGNAGYEQQYRTSHWGMYGGHNCTNYAAYRLVQRGSDASWLRGRGMGWQWGVEAAERGIPVDSVPQVGDIAWWDREAGLSSSGHVAYVEAVDLAAGTFTVSEDNYSADFDWRVYRIAETTGFIRFPIGPTATFQPAVSVTRPA